MEKYVLILIVLASTISCNTENKKVTKKYTHELKIGDSIVLPNPNNGHFMTWNSQITKFNNQKILSRLKYKGKRGIEYFDLNNEKHITTQIFETEGNQGLGNVSNYFIISEDSIAIFNDRQLLLTNKDLKILEVYNYMDNYDKLWYILQDSNKGQVVFKNNKLYFGKADFEYTNSNAFYSSKISTEIDLATGEFIEHTSMTFPKSYFDKCWGNYTTRINRDYNHKNDNFIYSFPTNHNLFVFDPFEDKLKNTIEAKSVFLPEEFESMNCKHYDDYDREREYYLKTGKYLKILHDPYQDIYYRFVELPMNDEDVIYYTGRADALYSTEIAVMILDHNLKVIGETKLPKNTYINWDFFILEDGLYISANNPNNENYDEDKLVYHRFIVDNKNKPTTL